MTRFRNFKPLKANVIPHKIYVSQVVETPQEDGSIKVTQKLVDASSFCLPSPDQFQLKNLQAAGIPITTISPTILHSVPSLERVSNLVNSIVESKNNE
jgi:hypothetical protein